MSITEMFSIIGVVTIGFGLVITLVRNGRGETARNASLKTELRKDIQNINDKLENRMTGLGAIKKGVDDQRLHCVRVSTSLEEKVSSHTKDIDELKRRAS